MRPWWWWNKKKSTPYVQTMTFLLSVTLCILVSVTRTFDTVTHFLSPPFETYDLLNRNTQIIFGDYYSWIFSLWNLLFCFLLLLSPNYLPQSQPLFLRYCEREILNYPCSVQWDRSPYIYINTHTHTHTYIYIYIFTHTYTGCPRRNVPDLGWVFLMLKYTDITQNTYIQS